MMDKIGFLGVGCSFNGLKKKILSEELISGFLKDF
jgi:hypothetical protein